MVRPFDPYDYFYVFLQVDFFLVPNIPIAGLSQTSTT